MRWTTTDPRSSGLADSVGAVINYVSSGAFVTLVKVSTGSTDWATVDAVLPPAPLTQCPKTSSDPRTAGRKGAVDEVVLYYTASAGTYLIKYGTGDTDWVPLPVAFQLAATGVTAGSYTNTDLTVDQYGRITAATSGSGGGASSVYGSGVDGVMAFDGVNTFSGVASLAGSTYTLLRSIAPTDMSVSSGVTVKVAGCAIMGTGTLSGAGTIEANGNAGTAGANGSGGTGGTAPAGNFLPGGKAGGNGAINDLSSASQGTSSSACPVWFPVANGGAGGSSTVGPGNGTAGATGKGGGGGGRWKSYAAGGIAGARGGDVTSVVDDSVYTHLIIAGRQVAGSLFGGGTGGGGGASTDSWNDTNVQSGRGGGGGSSAGWVAVAFKTWSFTGTIQAVGGAGGAGYSFNNGGSGGMGSGGGGGGSGGTIILVGHSGAFPTTDVSGGVGGTGGQCSGGSSDNDKGGDGGAGGVGRLIAISA